MALRFHEDGTFRVLQMADIQDGPNVNPDTIRLIDAAIHASNPDLIVLTGDQIRGYDPAYMNTFLRRRGERHGMRVRAVTILEARLHGKKPAVAPGATAEEMLEDARQKVRVTFAKFLAPAMRHKIPFAATYGNHDFQCGILADEQDDIYREFEGCLNPPAPQHDDSTANGVAANNAASTDGDVANGNAAHDDVTHDAAADANTAKPDAANALASLACEPGTFALPIEASDRSGRIAMSVMLVNSGDYADAPDAAGSVGTASTKTAAPIEDAENADDKQSPAEAAAETLETLRYATNSRGLDLADSDGYGTPSPQALAWLRDVQHTLGAMNGDGHPVPSIAFQHIAPQEFYDCLREVPAWTPNAVEGARTFAGHCYIIDERVCRPGSRLGEAIGCADENVGEVEALRDAGGYFALYCGHDHKNSFVGHVHGLDLGYAPTCGFEAYGPKSRLRGIRLFEFHESNPAAYDTRMLTWGDLVGRYSSNELRIFFADHCVTDAIGLRNELRRPQVFATVTSLISAGLIGAVRTIARMLRKGRR